MKTALDSSVILDVITDDPKWAEASERALTAALTEGALVVGECVLAEITPALGDAELAAFLADWKIQFIPSSRDAAIVAGRMFARYLRRGGTARRVLADFLIGAHALTHADRLLARDRGYYRDYFATLAVVDPARP